MFQTLKNYAFGFMARIPIIREFVPEQYKNNSTISNSSRSELETLHKYPQAGFSNSDLEYKQSTLPDIVSPNVIELKHPPSSSNNQQEKINIKAALLPVMENLPKEVLSQRPDLKREISNQLKRLYLAPNIQANLRQEIEGEITKSAIGTLNSLITDYQKKLSVIKPTSSDKVNPEEYADLIQEYISKSLEFLLEVNNYIIGKTMTLYPHISNQDLTEALLSTRNISKKVAEEALGALYKSFSTLPITVLEGDQGSSIHIVQYVSAKLKDSIKTLYLASKFGIQSSELFQAFKNQIKFTMPQNLVTDDSVHNTLRLIKAFQEGTNGSVILNHNADSNQDIKIANLDKETKQQIINSLVQIIIKEYTIRHDDTLKNQVITHNGKLIKLSDFITNIKKDLASYLAAINNHENSIAQLVTETKKDPFWENCGLEDERANIEALYSTPHSVHSLLGRTNTELIMGHSHPGKPILDCLNINPNNPQLEIERIIHEVSLLAVIDVLSDFRGRKRENPVFDSYANFQSIPWLKPLYQARYKEYQSWLETKQTTPLPTRNLLRELARLGTELNGNSSQSNPMFSFFDFCQRYKIKDIGDAMIPRLFNLTDELTASLCYQVFSNLISGVRPGEQNGLTNDEVKHIQDLTDFLQEQSILKGKDGQQIVAINDDKLYEEKYKYMKALIGNRGFLILNTPIIIKFLLNSLGIEKNQVKDRSVETKNVTQALLLFYSLLKHLPDKSNNIDSLLKRQAVFATLIDNFESFAKQAPLIRNKFLKQSLGLNEACTAADPFNRSGVIPAMCQDMERQLDEYPKRAKSFQELREKRRILEEEYLQTHDSHIAKEINHLRDQERAIKPISLENLLSVYDQLSECINRNPRNIQQIQTILKDVKKVNRPLLKDIRHYIENLIEVEPIALINFIKTSANQELQTYTKKLLISQASKLAQELISSNSNNTNGTIQITDNDEIAIRKYTKVLNLLKYIAFLVNHYGANTVSINSAGIDETNTHLRQENINRINTVSELMRKSVLLLVDDSRINEEVFPGQLEAKRTLVELLEEFKVRPALDHKMEWISHRKAQKKIEDSIYFEPKPFSSHQGNYNRDPASYLPVNSRITQQKINSY